MTVKEIQNNIDFIRKAAYKSMSRDCADLQIGILTEGINTHDPVLINDSLLNLQTHIYKKNGNLCGVDKYIVNIYDSI